MTTLVAFNRLVADMTSALYTAEHSDQLSAMTNALDEIKKTSEAMANAYDELFARAVDKTEEMLVSTVPDTRAITSVDNVVVGSLVGVRFRLNGAHIWGRVIRVKGSGFFMTKDGQSGNQNAIMGLNCNSEVHIKNIHGWHGSEQVAVWT